MDWVTGISTEKQLECDVFVAGGGIAGVCAAISAARNGARVVLCHDRSVLGGNASSEVRMHICGADFLGNRSAERAVAARETGIIEEIRLENAVRNPQRSWSMHDLILYEKCMVEPKLTLLLDTPVVGVKVANGSIEKAYAMRSCTEDCFTIDAKVFIDCTGDGRMAAEAGASFFRGRESKSVFNEVGAPPKHEDGEMGMSLLFEAEDMGKPIPYELPKWARKFKDEELALRDCSKFNYGYWWIEWGGYKDTVKDLPVVREKLLGILLGVWDYIKNSGKYDSENYALKWFGFLPGKRQSRRFKGLYTLTENDVKKPSPFYDTIAYGGWPFDSHPAGGIDSDNQEPSEQEGASFIYPIPLRSCISSEINNLMFAGRNISASYIAFTSARVMATCGVVGQGVGAAAALAVKNDISLIELLQGENIREVQNNLLNDDCFLPYVDSTEDEISDTAIVEASSYLEGCEPDNVKSALTRSLDGLLPDYNSSNYRWCSDADCDMPQWLMMSWEHEVKFNCIRIVFDTGLHRPLTLTKDKLSGMDEKMYWQVQPETVRNYSLFYESPEGWKEILSVKDNYQRLNTHAFDCIKAKKIRLVIDQAGEFSLAKVCRLSVCNL
ncbi:MAG: FAD-dependent oxidoreductase [Sedimentisphaeraceae bacterium JB056]